MIIVIKRQVIKIGTKSKGISSLLADYSKTLDYFVGALLITLGIYLYFVGFEDVKILITLSSVILIIYGIKKILDAIIRTLMGKELEQLIAKREK